MKRRGFTLIELLVVISIISLLASIIFASLNEARDKAKIARAQADLVQLRNAMALLEADTGKWPNGCPAGKVVQTGGPTEAFLNSMQAGIFGSGPACDCWKGDISDCPGKPECGTTQCGTACTNQTLIVECEWSGSEARSWNGPYMDTPFDPWGSLYYYDGDYPAYGNKSASNQPFYTNGSFGDSDGSGGNGYQCPQGLVQPAVAALVSFGPDKFGPNLYNCDDIFLKLTY